MENEKSTAGETGRINWHPAFIEAIQMELAAYRDCLEFHSEYQLTSDTGALLMLKHSRLIHLGLL
jgi:hypothetical protein